MNPKTTDDLGKLQDLVEKPQPHPVTSSTLSAINGFASTVNPLLTNPIVQSAIQVMGQIADIGKVLPFVAPAFVLLKVIIDMEMKAQDVDAKCNDLIERITFMLSHLPVLQTIEIKTSTQQVFDRIIGALQDAAALITAYRKQGRIARRLSLNNREKFTTCAETVNVCCSDLMMSLQIHQVGKLEILTRAVPVDAEDEAARTFVASHGSLDAIRRSPQLVNEFAEQQHLTMGDEVMGQLNANINDAIRQINIRLAVILKGNMGAAIIDGIKGLVAEMRAAEAQQHFICVQCDKEFTVTTNGPKACSFHRAQRSDWGGYSSFPCCGNSQPCQFQFHRENHHCDYPYAAFFQARGTVIRGNVDTVDVWASVRDTNLESGKEQKASVGRLLRWVSGGERIAMPIILITVGTVRHDEPYFFDTYTIKELDSVSRFISLTQQTVIYRTSPSESGFDMAEWILSSEGSICGVRVTSQAATSPCPFVRECFFDATNFQKSDETLTLSEGGIPSYKPSAPYIIPETIRIGPDLSDEELRPPRTDFMTHTTDDLPVIMKVMSDPPLKANTYANFTVDYFEGVVSVFNKSPANTGIPITIASVSAAYRFVGDANYLPVSHVRLDGAQLPVTIDPRQSWPLKFEVTILRSKEDASLKVSWNRRAFMARRRPLRIKLILESIEGEQCSLVLEYIYKWFPLIKGQKGSVGFFYIDDATLFERSYVEVEASTASNEVINIGHIGIQTKRLEMIVYRAIKTGVTEIDLGLRPYPGIYEWAAYALVDTSCRRVYAFKILLQQGKEVETKTTYCLGYVLCPSYGNVLDESRPICYATEKVELPVIEPVPVVSYATDDTLDDYVPEDPKKLPASAMESLYAPIQFIRRIVGWA